MEEMGAKFPMLSPEVVALIFVQRNHDLNLVERDLTNLDRERQNVIDRERHRSDAGDEANIEGSGAAGLPNGGGDDNDGEEERLVAPIRRRVLSPMSVRRHSAGTTWVATLAPPTCRVLGEFASREDAMNMAPHMLPPVWQSGSTCAFCDTRVGGMQRRHHCRNCGSVACSQCSGARWPIASVPPAYRFRHDTGREEKTEVRVCRACDRLVGAFRKALLQGDLEAAKDLEATGNLNLNCAFASHPQQQYPVHVAALGGNVDLLRWLVNERYCPLTGATGWPLTTADGKSVLALACERRHMELLHVCVTEFNCSTTEVTDVTALQAMLYSLVNIIRLEDIRSLQRQRQSNETDATVGSPALASASAESQLASVAAQIVPVPPPPGPMGLEEDDDNVCVICFEERINCVLVPCGHSCLCLGCVDVLKEKDCPVCRNTFNQAVKIFHVHSKPSSLNSASSLPTKSSHESPVSQVLHTNLNSEQ